MNSQGTSRGRALRDLLARICGLAPSSPPPSETGTDGELNGIMTRATCYRAYDGRERVVLLMDDYKRLLEKVK